jgi:thiamine-phosphate pyrophosphorylase
VNKIKFFFFSNTLNEIIIKNIIKFKNICIIYKPEKQVSTNDKQISEIKNFCKKNNIYFYIADNYKLAIKYNVDGIFLSSSNKNFIKPNQIKKNFDIIGSAHNTFEYSIKIQQNCRRIMLSPIFFNKKYSINKILNVAKFNLITRNWKSEVCALGGINLNNLKKIRMSKASSVAFISLINSPEIKKPIYLFR